ncbi:MAG: ATP-dependent sacrificial sulfur transferase LarE [Deltaproteobacteria bacterium]|nr:ATP-dependent sacrificial sulfur transferase LarE [Deltaproteobacteria bacterium]
MQKLEKLQEILNGMGSVLVAYSGGVDSAFVAKVAFDLLGDRAVAVTALSPSFPSYEVADLHHVAKGIGIKHLTVETKELENPDYRANRGDRCYFCKSELYQYLIPKAKELGIQVIVNGTNVDDLSDIRPGLKAAQDYQIRSPLVEAGLTKVEIRALSRELGLSTAEKPALACLSSRFPVGTEVTPERLRRIDNIESGLSELGFKVFRARFHEPIVRIELGQDELARLLVSEVREKVDQLCRESGFAHATIDLAPLLR